MFVRYSINRETGKEIDNDSLFTRALSRVLEQSPAEGRSILGFQDQGRCHESVELRQGLVLQSVKRNRGEAIN